MLYAVLHMHRTSDCTCKVLMVFVQVDRCTANNRRDATRLYPTVGCKIHHLSDATSFLSLLSYFNLYLFLAALSINLLTGTKLDLSHYGSH